MKPKSLSGISYIFGSTTAIRLAVAFIFFIWIGLIYSTVSSPDFIWSSAPGILFDNVPFAGFIYIVTKFSNVFHTQHHIIIHNFYGKVTYSKSDFLDIRIVTRAFPLYQIVFHDGKKYLFSTSSGYLSLDSDRDAEVVEMKKALMI